MARSARLTIPITTDYDSRGTRRAEQDLSRLQRSGQKSLSRLKTAAIGASAAVGTGLVVGLFKSVEAAREAEVSQSKLEAQLKASGISYKAHAAEIDNVIQKTMQLTGLDDEDLQDAFTNIVRITGDVNKSLRLTGLAADFARAKHMDVAKAGEIVAKVAGGNTGILSRYGITIRKGADATEALASLQKRFAGQGAAYGRTTSGAIDRARNAAENLGETIGGAVAPKLTQAANAAAKFIDQMRTGTGAGGRFRDTLEGIVDKVRPIAKFFTDHPRLIAIAVGAWAVYKAASMAAVAALNVRRFRRAFFKSVPAAGEAGAAAGSAYSTSFAATSAAGVTKAGRTGKLRNAATRMGRGLGIAAGVAMAASIAAELQGDSGLLGLLKNIMPLSPRPSKPNKNPVLLIGSEGPTINGRRVDVPGPTPSPNHTEGAFGGPRRRGSPLASLPRLSGRFPTGGHRPRGAGPKVSGRLGTIDFNLEMERISTATAIDQYQALLKTHGISKQTRREILLKIKGLQDQTAADAEQEADDAADNAKRTRDRIEAARKRARDNRKRADAERKRARAEHKRAVADARRKSHQDDESSDFELNVGSIRIPTVYEVRRSRLERARVHGPHAVGQSSQPTVVHNGDVNITIEGAGKHATEIAEETMALIRRRERTMGAAAKRARGGKRR